MRSLLFKRAAVLAALLIVCSPVSPAAKVERSPATVSMRSPVSAEHLSLNSAIATPAADVPDWITHAPTNSHISQADNIWFYRHLSITPEWMMLRAMLRTIGRMEGTYDPNNPKQRPYNVMFSGRRIDSLQKHPDTCIAIDAWGKWADDCSTAAGMSQWITTTWNDVRSRWRSHFWFPDGEFSERNQDLATVRHLVELGVYTRMMTAIRIDRRDPKNLKVAIDYAVYKTVVDRYLSRPWASFPCLTGVDYDGLRCKGRSYYGQGGKPMAEAWQYMQEELNRENAGAWRKQVSKK